MLIFDGDCGFCTTSARWIEDRLPEGTAVEPWQALDIDALGLTEADVTTAAYWIDEDGTAHRGHRAIEFALKQAGSPWRAAGTVIGLPPFVWLAPVVYRLVAKYRYKLPGATDACRLPSAPADDSVSSR